MTSRPRPSERSIVEVAAAFLRAEGFRTLVDPAGNDYFDLAAIRGDEVGLVEAKVAGSREVLAQALRRRAWSDWVAVALGSRRAAGALESRTRGTRSEPVGVWAVDRGTLEVLRAPRRWRLPGEDDPFAPLRERFRSLLELVGAGRPLGELPWDGVLGSVRRASRGRGFREWRLDEAGPTESPGPDD